ncbi:CpXC domain-containing protein [Sphaerobacter thermophilus]|jgi:hypothetical protein|uniref:CpXC domain-containing protein n=1 Tax=Sphaerobacter thermophilus (strain ATCC 49802 / DSM 20745 / KCCM 41009 / NCIMB 13125 / S 6022) TaxID=479434 RepID=D1C5I3_SPHTD|nr:CpXC domain-containing protein [Sphaerobacter thermophilus]ACZ37499.1 hypothetical protein Sthe_0060 [Sphaerobacter thermophilus DSM 20745]PZN63418.1 MAG: hypothetical protein DIU58_10810 [Sphaerobacter thermophilus]
MVLQTQYASVDIRCPHCRATWEVPVARYVNVGTDPDARLGILLGTMHRSRCPVCKREQAVDFIFDYYDPEQNLVVQVRPEWEIRAGGGEDWYWQRYEDLVQAYASHDVRVDVVFGFQEMIDKYLGGEEAVAAAKREWDARKAGAKPASEQDAPPEEPAGESGSSTTEDNHA